MIDLPQEAVRLGNDVQMAAWMLGVVPLLNNRHKQYSPSPTTKQCPDGGVDAWCSASIEQSAQAIQSLPNNQRKSILFLFSVLPKIAHLLAADIILHLRHRSNSTDNNIFVGKLPLPSTWHKSQSISSNTSPTHSKYPNTLYTLPSFRQDFLDDVDSHAFSFASSSLQGAVPPHWILLDNQLTVDIVANTSLLRSIHDSEIPITYMKTKEVRGPS